MSCMFRVFGSDLEIDALLDGVALEPNRVWHKGDLRFKHRPDGEVLVLSGASFIASDADMNEFDVQIKEVKDFLSEHCAEIQKMVQFPGVEGGVLDFGIELRNVAVHGDFLPLELLQLAAQAGVGIQLSHYPCSSENES